LNSFIDILKKDNCDEFFLELKRNHQLINVFPELDALSGVQQIGNDLHKENFYHTIVVLQNVCKISKNPYLRVVALFHDLGKALTKKHDPIRGWTFHNHENESVKMLKRLFEKFSLDMNQFSYVEKIVSWHGIAQELTSNKVTESAIRRFYKAMGDDLRDMIDFCKCDVTTRNIELKNRYHNKLENLYQKCIALQKKDVESQYRLPIDGKDIMDIFNISPGRKIAEIKNLVDEAIKNKKIPDEREAALNFLQELKGQNDYLS
jgi:poly(A) polymerase